MNQSFKLRFDQMREGDPTDPDAIAQIHDPAFYQTPGHTRNLCLVWPDGRRFFLNYAYLVAAEFKPEADKNGITLVFSSHVVSLQGYGLEDLFMALLDHLPRLIAAIDPRYVLDETKTEPIAIVTEIRVEQKEN